MVAYNRPLSSRLILKKYINKRFGHNLKFKSVYVSSSILHYEDFYNQHNIRKNQNYQISGLSYNFICKKCGIQVQFGYGTGLNKHKIHWDFVSNDDELDRWNCNDWLIKKLVE